jgi:hypothetical protein
MLSLCALDAQAQGSKELGFRALKEIIRQYGSMPKEAQQEIRLPVLCRYLPPLLLFLIWRCVIRFTYAEIEAAKDPDSSSITILCGHFETGASTLM